MGRAEGSVPSVQAIGPRPSFSSDEKLDGGLGPRLGDLCMCMSESKLVCCFAWLHIANLQVGVL